MPIIFPGTRLLYWPVAVLLPPVLVILEKIDYFFKRLRATLINLRLNSASFYSQRGLIPRNPPFGGGALGRLKTVTPTRNGSRPRK
jgi:hypothetical protein